MSNKIAPRLGVTWQACKVLKFFRGIISPKPDYPSKKISTPSSGAIPILYQHMEKKSRQNPTSAKEIKDDKILDSALRPKSWNEFIGQQRIKKNLKIIIQAAKKRNELCTEHLLFYGNPGLGKTTLSHLIAKEIGSGIRTTSGPAIEKAGDLAAILTNLSDGDVLFLDEIHGLNRTVEEFLYPALEDYKLHLILGKGPMARTMDIDLPRFTLIGATTKLALLSSPLRNRFGATFQLNFYNEENIGQIIKRSASLLKTKIDQESINTIAKRSRYTPRVANRLLKRVRDWAEVEADGKITKEIVEQALNFLEIDELGLEIGDRRVIKTLINKFNGGPAGLQAIAAASAEEKDAILDIYEPYLMQLGFIQRTKQGRTATHLAYEHLGIKTPNQKKLIK